MKRCSWLMAAVFLLLASGCLDNRSQQQVLLELDKVNERLNNVNRRFDRLQMEAQVLKQQVEQQQSAFDDLYRDMESMRSELMAAARRKTPPDQPPPSVSTEEEDIRQDPGQQQSVGQFLQQMRPR